MEGFSLWNLLIFPGQNNWLWTLNYMESVLVSAFGLSNCELIQVASAYPVAHFLSPGILYLFIFPAFFRPGFWFFFFFLASVCVCVCLALVVFLAFLFFHLPSMQLYWINIFFRFSCNYKSLIEFSRLVVFFFSFFFFCCCCCFCCSLLLLCRAEFRGRGKWVAWVADEVFPSRIHPEVVVSLSPRLPLTFSHPNPNLESKSEALSLSLAPTSATSSPSVRILQFFFFFLSAQSEKSDHENKEMHTFQYAYICLKFYILLRLKKFIFINFPYLYACCILQLFFFCFPCSFICRILLLLMLQK